MGTYVELLLVELVIVVLVYATVAAVFQAVLSPKTNRIWGAVLGVFWPGVILSVFFWGALESVAKMFRNESKKDC